MVNQHKPHQKGKEVPLVVMPKSKAKASIFAHITSEQLDNSTEGLLVYMASIPELGIQARFEVRPNEIGNENAIDAISSAFRDACKEHRSVGDLEEWLQASGLRYGWRDADGHPVLVREAQ